jgi:hypothetical protein
MILIIIMARDLQFTYCQQPPFLVQREFCFSELFVTMALYAQYAVNGMLSVAKIGSSDSER